ncbi:MAG: carbon-nitrogen family hydrolase [Eubacteriales bacterium]|nr:carbon-nitrogen family hydrolase [Eubacteriales bacterium]
MKITCIQMDMIFEKPDENFEKAECLIRKAASEGPDVIVLPETWNTGFYPHGDIASLADENGERVCEMAGRLAKELKVNIIAGSVTEKRGSDIYNTAHVFNREGKEIASYDKTHLFSPMGEHESYQKGDRKCMFTLDGVKCALIICYDVRFPELTRSMTVEGVDVLFNVAQWPKVRMEHYHTLLKARAIENQMFTVGCNSCGSAGETVYGGGSVIFDPWGRELICAGEHEESISADCDMSIIKGIRESINVFRDRRPEMYI